MKTQEEIVIQAKAYAESIGNEDGISVFDYMVGYNNCQQDMVDKKYTEEDVIHLMFNATKWDTFKEGEVGYDMSLSEYIQHCLHKLNKQD